MGFVFELSELANLGSGLFKQRLAWGPCAAKAILGMSGAAGSVFATHYDSACLEAVGILNFQRSVECHSLLVQGKAQLGGQPQAAQSSMAPTGALPAMHSGRLPAEKVRSTDADALGNVIRGGRSMKV